MTEDEILSLFDTCCNWNRWPDHAERGTLNYISYDVTLRALRLVQYGVVVSLGRILSSRDSDPTEFVHHMLPTDDHSVADETSVSPHGFTITHMDAIGHSLFRDRIYGGRQVEPNTIAQGLLYGSIEAMRDGIVTRGVLLDVAGARGVSCLENGETITIDDLIAAERLAGVTVSPGDAVFVRAGRTFQAPDTSPNAAGNRTGVDPSTLAWFHERQVAVYSGDCIERVPSGYSSIPMPLHQVGHVAMGLAILDNPDVPQLYRVAKAYHRHTFLLVVAPLRIVGGTGSAVNPLAVF